MCEICQIIRQVSASMHSLDWLELRVRSMFLLQATVLNK